GGNIPAQMDPPSVEEITFNCRFCGKKFRRRSYLRKHLALHNRNATGVRLFLSGSPLPPTVGATSWEPH
uniref:C2H2-type domain-containing protein n=1 Tax=Scleropages formosus TaxID=113540 RepID=A0A8C9R1P4_SCLFO